MAWEEVVASIAMSMEICLELPNISPDLLSAKTWL
jgi:hypothetical protein